MRRKYRTFSNPFPGILVAAIMADIFLYKLMSDLYYEKKEPRLGDCKYKAECRHVHELLEANRELAEKLDKIHMESDLE